MQYYCCFTHPRHHENPKSINDKCEICGEEYGFPISSPPQRICGNKVTQALSRGFFGATYVLEKPPFSAKIVYKVIPKSLYSFFSKDFDKECQVHWDTCTNSDHLVKIVGKHEETIQFGNGIEIECHIAELEYVPGTLLSDYFKTDNISANSVAQIAIDFLRLLADLEDREVRHNDLHDGNIIIEQLPDRERRRNAIDDRIRLKALDLGSVSDESTSDPNENRIGDLKRVATHLRRLTTRLLSQKDSDTPSNHRLLVLLDEFASELSHRDINHRLPSYQELEDRIHEVIYAPVVQPWSKKLALKRFSDSYNALTLDSSFVPGLLVDPNEAWSRKLIAKGPTIMTGMRGCGKTMLLKSAHFHSRALKKGFDAPQDEKTATIQDDGFIGLFAASSRILSSFSNPFEKLFLCYVKDWITILQHTKQIDRKLVPPDIVTHVSKAISTYLSGCEKTTGAPSLARLHSDISKFLILINEEGDQFKLRTNPTETFTGLAESIQQSSPLFSNSYILFLLDDVSTRYLSEENVRNLVSELLFNNEKAAFKFTTEAQTLELVIRTPGQNEAAWQGRDYEIFDLGYEVNEKMNERGKEGGKNFLLNVLSARSAYHSTHPNNTPSEVLGDVSMEAIARGIAQATSSQQRKRVYRGISALAGICVGDIGDAIKIYDEIIKKADTKSLPVSDENQSEAYQAYCSRRLYDLTRRDTFFKDHAITFSTISHDLLVHFSEIEKDRLRQYTKIYVTVSEKETTKQFELIRKLVDAGVFVLDGGTETPRSKSIGKDPITQFKLSFRKLYGLAKLMPIADRDRIELSGKDLELWLSNPEKARATILKKETGTARLKKRKAASPKDNATKTKEKATQVVLSFDTAPEPTKSESAELAPLSSINDRLPQVIPLNKEQLTSYNATTIYAGLGFEDRTLGSYLRQLETFPTLNKSFLFQYSIEGQTAAMVAATEKSGIDYSIKDEGADIEVGIKDEIPLIDITGLKKQLIYRTVRDAVETHSEVLICRTSAEDYYPRNQDLESLISKINSEDNGPIEILEELKKILTGEAEPYQFTNLVDNGVDESQERALCAFSNSKHERILSLLDSREYDSIFLCASEGPSPRDKISQFASDVAAQNYNNVEQSARPPKDVMSMVEWIARSYQKSFIELGYNFELGLTGDKLHSVAAAIASTVLKISACWYLSPNKFDENRYTLGTGRSSYWLIRRQHL